MDDNEDIFRKILAEPVMENTDGYARVNIGNARVRGRGRSSDSEDVTRSRGASNLT